jgi:hypothetical protein
VAFFVFSKRTGENAGTTPREKNREDPLANATGQRAFLVLA